MRKLKRLNRFLKLNTPDVEITWGLIVLQTVVVSALVFLVVG